MSRLGRVARRIPVWLSLLVAGLAWLAFTWRETSVAVVVDLTTFGRTAAAAALILGAVGLFILRRSSTPISTTIGLLAALGSVVVIGAWYSYEASYESAEVRFLNGEVELAGTLFVPDGDGPWPAAVMIHGSGPETRREGAFLARYLARRGVAGLAYDKRGTGESGGELYESDYVDYAGDAAAAVALLRSDPRIHAAWVGLVGVSEGEWVAPTAAAQSDGVAFVVVVGASGLSPSEQVTEEIVLRLEALGHPEADIDRARTLSEQVLEYQRSGERGPELGAALDQAGSEDWFEDAEGFPEKVHPIDEYTWWRGVMDADPGELWRQVRAPVLLLKGGADVHSRPGPMEARVRSALAAGGNRDLTVHLFPGADHNLLHWPRGPTTPPPAFADGYPEIVVEFIRDQVGPRDAAR